MSTSRVGHATKQLVKCPFMRQMNMKKIDLSTLPMFASNYNEHCPFLKLSVDTQIFIYHRLIIVAI